MNDIRYGSPVYFRKVTESIDTSTKKYIALCETGNTKKLQKMLADTVVLQTIEWHGSNLSKGSCLTSSGKGAVIHYLATHLFSHQQQAMHKSTTSDGALDRTITFNTGSTPHSIAQLVFTLQFRYPARLKGKTELSCTANDAPPLISHIAVSSQSIRV